MLEAATIDALVDRLQLFNCKVEKLASLSAYRHVTSKTTTARVHWERDKGWDSAFDGPGAEALDATVLTLRQFMQKNDPVSLLKMRRLYEDTRVGREVRATFSQTTARLDAFLDGETNISIEPGRNLTRRDVLNIFIYGGMAHSSPRYRATYESLTTTPFFPILQVEFVTAVGTFVSALQYIAGANQQALQVLAASGGA